MFSSLVALSLAPLLAPPSVHAALLHAELLSPTVAVARGCEAVRELASDDPRALRIPRAARGATAAVEIDRRSLEAFVRAGGGVLSGVPTAPGVRVDLCLAPVEPFTADAVVEFVRKRNGRLIATRTAAVAQGVFLAGSVAGEPDSRAYIAVSAAGEFGFIERAGRRSLISSGPYGRGLPTVAYDASALPDGLIDLRDWQCNAIDAPDGASAEGGIAAAACRQIRIAFDSDEEFLQLFGGNTDAALAYMATLSGALNTIYARDLNARVALNYARIWPDPPDPWDRTTLIDQLGQLRTRWETESPSPRDLVQLLMGRSLGGGIAWVPGICSSYAYSVASGITGSFPTPLVNNSLQNWDIMVSAHEIGHGLNMGHTHQLQPPVDGCGLSPQDCSVASAGQGTIMSYCHTCAGGMANIRLEFHQASITQSLNFLSNSACNYGGAAVPPVALADRANGFAGFPTTIDVLANEADLNCEAIVISAFSATSSRGAAITRSVGTGPGGRDELRYALPAGAAAGTDSFSYTVRDTSGQTATTTVLIDAYVPRQPENPVGATASLNANYFTITTETALPDFSARTPYAISTVAQLNYPSTLNTFASSGRSDFVGARFTGWLAVPATGLWTISCASDEGSRVSIGSTVVVDHDGVHDFSERSGAIALAAGVHAITVDYFERTGFAGLVLSWQGPGVAKQVIPASQLYRGGSTVPADLNGDGAVDSADIAVILSAWGAANSPYDLTGDGVVGGADLAVVLFHWTG